MAVDLLAHPAVVAWRRLWAEPLLTLWALAEQS